MKIYMLVTADKYELPLKVFDTAKELSEYVKRPIGCVYSSLTRGNTDINLKAKYRKVEIKE